MSVEVNIGGVWKDVASIEVNVGGVWKTVNDLEVNIATVWKNAGLAVYSIDGETIVSSDNGSPAESEAGVRFNADGTLESKIRSEGGSAVYAPIDAATDWVIPNSVGATTHYIKATQTSQTDNETTPTLLGATLSGTMGSWITLGGAQSREWSIQGNTAGVGEGSSQWIISFQIATDSGGTNVVATGSITMNAGVGP